MKLFYIMMVLMLLGALALPFFVKGPDGQPIVTVDDMVGDGVSDAVGNGLGGVVGNLAPSEPLELYRWQDEHGLWQFGENAPQQFTAAKVSVDDSRTTSMGSEWNLTETLSQTGTRDPVDFKMPNSLTDAYGAAPELIGATRRARDALNNRQLDMDDFLEGLNEKYSE